MITQKQIDKLTDLYGLEWVDYVESEDTITYFKGQQQMNDNMTIEFTKAEVLFLDVVLQDEYRECTKRYDSFLEELEKENGLKYPDKAEDSFLRILGRISTLRHKLNTEKVK